MKVLLTVACLGAMSAMAYARPMPALQTAKVLSQNIGTYNGGAAVMPIGTMLVGVPITRRSNIVVIETPHYRLTLTEAANDKHLLVLDVNGTVQFYLDHQWLVIPDSEAKKHKFSVTHIEDTSTPAN